MTILFSTEADFLGASIAVGEPDVRTAGYFTPGDGGGHIKKRISTPSPIKPWHKQSADGAWWELSESAVAPQMLGARADFSWSSGTGTDDTLAIRAALAYGKKVFVPQGQYRVTGELEMVKAGQVLEFENTGGYGYAEDIGELWAHNTAFVGTGTFTKRVRTRRKHRANSGSPQDAPISVILNIQNENITLKNVCIRLYCDYSNASPTNLGDNCDVGIFVGCRVSTQFHNPIVTDYFRVAGIYFDVTNRYGLPRFPSVDGPAYPVGSVQSGADGCHLFNPYVRGPRIGVAVLGSLPAAGYDTYGPDYYDQLLGGTIADARGSFGFSDFCMFGGRIYGPDHHSQRRRADPTRSGGTLNQTSLLAEPDFMPAAMHIDGMASGHGIWGMNFYGTRFATIEAFRVRLDRAERVRFWGCHIEGRNGGRLNTAGVEINTNDYALHTYGDISGTTRTEKCSVWGTVRDTLAAGLGPHYYGPSGLLVDTDSGRRGIGKGGYFQSEYGEVDYRALTGFGHRWRHGNATLLALESSGALRMFGSVVADSGELDLRGATGSGVRLRTNGAATSLVVPSGGVYANSSASSANVTITAGNVLGRSTSSAKYKTDVEDMAKASSDLIAKLRPVWYRSLCEGDNKDWSYYGLIAEEVAAVDPRLVHWRTTETTFDEDGEEVVTELATPVAEGVMYDRLVVHLIAKVNELEARLG